MAMTTPTFFPVLPIVGQTKPFKTRKAATAKMQGLTILNDGGAEINILNAVGYNVAAQSFSCSSEIDFLSQGISGTQLYEGVYASGSATYNTLGPVQSVDYNALGFNPNDNYLYGMDYAGGTPGTLYKIGSGGNAVSLGLVSNYPGGDNVPYAGAFDPSGNYWISGGGLYAAAYEIDVSSQPPAIINTVVLSQPWGASDFTYSAGYMWGLNGTTIYRLNLTDGTVDTYSAPSAVASGEYGAAWTFGNTSGDLGFSNNDTGDIYRISITNPSTTPTFTVVAHYTGPKSAANDGASCFASEPVDLEMGKTGPATVAPGGAISWTLTVTNNGPGNSSGFSVTDSVPAGVGNVLTTTAGCAVSANNVLCSEGALADSSIFTITITGTAPSSGCITNTATVTGIETDPTPDNNSASAQTCSGTAPAITSANNTMFGLGTSGLFTVTTTGNPTPSLIESGTLPSGVLFQNNGDGTGTLSGIPAQAGTFDIMFTASNGEGSPFVQNFTLTVSQGSTKTSVQAYDAATGSPWSNTEVTGASAYATSAVSPTPTGGPTPTGNVTYLLYGGNSCTGNRFFSSTVDLVSGAVPASTTSAPLGAGAYSFQATYSGDQNYTGSSACSSFSVSKATTTIAVTSVSPSSEGYGRDTGVTITAVLSGSINGFPPAAFAVSIGGNGPSGYSTTSCGAPSAGTLTCTATYTPTAADTVGSYTETASFSGDANYTTSSSTQSDNFSITQASTSTSVGSGQNPSLLGQSVTFTATIDGEYGLITVVNGASPRGVKQRGAHPLSPTGGSLTWSANTGCSASPVTSLPARVTCNTSALPAGNDTITASYSGDINHSGSMGTLPGGQAVDQSPVFTSANSAVFTIGVAGSFTVTTLGYPTPSLMAAGHIPTGLSFHDNGNGTATLAGTPLILVGGDFPITITAKNGIGSPVTETVIIIVQQPPSFTSANNAVFVYGVPNTFTVTTSAFPVASIHEAGTLPPWLTFVDNGNGTATLSGTPSYVSGTFALVLTATNVVATCYTELHA